MTLPQALALLKARPSELLLIPMVIGFPFLLALAGIAGGN